MPNAILQIEDSHASITRLITESVMKQVLYYTDIHGAEIIYNEPLGHGKNAAANSNPDGPTLKLDSKDYLIVNYVERFDTGYVGAFSTADEHLLIFKDTDLGIRAKPLTALATIELEITYRSKSYNTINMWLSRFQRNKLIREPHNYHNLNYNYLIPDVMAAYIYDVYKLIQNVAPPDVPITMKDYFNQHYTKGLVTRSNLAGKNNSYAINVESKGQLGYFTSLPEQVSSDKDKLFHEVTFTYVLNYEKPTDIILEYQVFIHNQRIDKVYTPFFKPSDPAPDVHTGLRTFSGGVNTGTERLGWYKLELPDIFLDKLDTFHPAMPIPRTSTMLIVPIQLDPNDKTLVSNIDDIPSNSYHTLANTLLKQWYAEATVPYASPFHLELYEVGATERSMPITMDVNGVIRTNVEMDLRKRHYLRISVLVDLTMCSSAIIRELLKNISWVRSLLLMLNPDVNLGDDPNVVGGLKYLFNGTIVDSESFYLLIGRPSKLGLPLNLNDNNYGVRRNTVGNTPIGTVGWNNLLFGYYVENKQQSSTIRIKGVS